nr:YodL domain-containing protein [Anaeromassilibacillus sp. An200]
MASLLDPQRRKQRFLLYQLELDEQNAIPFAFKDVEALKKAGYEQPPAAQYRLVWTGEIYCPTEQSDAEVLKRLFSDFSEELPEGCCGRQIALSDVIELDHEPKRTYYYVSGQNDFRQVRFSPMLAKKDRPEGI